MQSLSCSRNEDNTSFSITLDLLDENNFRLAKFTTDSFGVREEICNGNFLIEGDLLKLESVFRYEYSKYITDLEPSEVFHNVSEIFKLKREGNGYRFENEFLLTENKPE